MDHATTVENAVKRFYASGDNDTHSWLLQVQASQEAWTFLCQLLDSSKSGEVQFFGATTLHLKISKQWGELPKSEYLGLQNRILQVLKCPGTSKVVLSRLCQALAAFMVNCMSEEENEEKCEIEQLTEILPYNSPETVNLLVRVLGAFPGEFSRKQDRKEPRQRARILRNWYKTVQLLQHIFSCSHSNDTDSNALYLSGVECTLSWLTLGHLPLDTIAEIYPHITKAYQKT